MSGPNICGSDEQLCNCELCVEVKPLPELATEEDRTREIFNYQRLCALRYYNHISKQGKKQLTLTE